LSDSHYHQVPHIVARNAICTRKLKASRAVQRKCDPYLLAIIAVDLEAVRETASVTFIDRKTAVMPLGTAGVAIEQ
jgi:hypothetical protein